MSNGLEQTIIIKSKSKLSLKEGFLIVESDASISEYCLNNIDCIIVSSTPTSFISTTLLNELITRDITVIILDNRHNPYLNIVPLYGSFNSSSRLIKQINWVKERKISLFEEIIKNKIKIQGETLVSKGLEKKNIFNKYILRILNNDEANVEGQCSKMYFVRLFGKGFNRRDPNNSINAFLNYGYSLIVSFINQEIIKHGYRTELGIHHCSQTNNFNLTYDLFEPFRSIVDEYVYNLGDKKELTFDLKIKMIDIFEREIIINNKKYKLKEGIKYFIINCLKYIEVKNRKFPEVSYIHNK